MTKSKKNNTKVTSVTTTPERGSAPGSAKPKNTKAAVAIAPPKPVGDTKSTKAPKAVKSVKEAPQRVSPTSKPSPRSPKEKVAMNARVTKPIAPKRASALDAAAQVLAKAKKPMRAGELIEQMATQGLWTSPGGKTPAATLYSAMMREINEKGTDARFTKVERGLFVAHG